MNAVSGTVQVHVIRASSTDRSDKDDRVAVEAPLEFQLHHPDVGYEPLSFGATMRTPGDDEWLAAGLLYGEGIVNTAADIDSIESSTRRPNVVNVRLRSTARIEVQAPAQRFSAGSSCGVCGTTGLDAAIARAASIEIPDTRPLAVSLLLSLPQRMREAQLRFADTGGIHAAALFDFEGQMLSLAEDVGRHNALDKLIGENLLAGNLPFRERIVLLSGRASFELTQKALRAGVAVLASVGAPSSLAVSLANTSGLSLVGFLRETHCNIYSNPGRLATRS